MLLTSCHPPGFVTLDTNYDSDKLVVSDFAFWKTPVVTYWSWSFSASLQVKVDCYIYVRMITNRNIERGTVKTYLIKGQVYPAWSFLLTGTDSLFRFEVYLFNDGSYTTPTDSFSLDFKIDKNSIKKISNMQREAYRLESQENQCIIAGKVIDKKDGKPLTYCTVLVLRRNLGATTNDEGNYEIRNLFPGIYTLQFSQIGYKDLEIDSVVVVKNKPTHIDAALEEEQVQSY